MKTVRCILFGLLGIAALGSGGCGGDSPALSAETDEPFFREAQQMEKQGRTEEALSDYLKVISKRGDQAPDSYLDVGLIYLQHHSDPIDAIYYFRKYLELLPNSKQAGYVRELVDRAKRDFARSLPAHPMDSEMPKADLTDEVEQLQKENAQLKSELAALRSAGPTPAFAIQPSRAIAVKPMPEDASPIQIAPISAQAQAPRTAASVKTSASSHAHTVVKGDTLVSLARQYYKNPSRWRDIFAANRDQLPDEKAMKVGMILKIP